MNKQQNQISIILITKNEENNIVECLKSVSWADEIVIVDSQSTDRTIELAKMFTGKIFVIEWKGYAAAKNYALEKVTRNWVFWIDADERASPELSKEIQNIVQNNDNMFNGFKIARRAYFIGKWIKHCGWYPGYVIRLFKKDCGKFSNSIVHEAVEIKGQIGQLKNDLVHYTDENLFHYFTKLNRYTSLAAEDLLKDCKRFSIGLLIIKPVYTFIRMYFLRLGFLDGIHGLILSLLSSAYVFVKYAKYWEIQLNIIES